MTDFQHLVPQYWNLTLRSMEDVIFLGKVNINQMIKSWRWKAESELGSDEKARELARFLEGRTAEDFQEMAKEYENPKFPSVEVPKDSWVKENEPTDADSIIRKRGATTFNVCGWCEHTSGGSCRYNYMISGSCEFENYLRAGQSAKKFYTPCFLPHVQPAYLEKLIKSMNHRSCEAKSDYEAILMKIEILERALGEAEEKPALPDRRPSDWFDIGDPLVCYVGAWKGNKKLTEADIAVATVIEGYRHHDGCVSVCYDEKIHDGEYLEGRGGGYGMSRPEIMHQWEFEYLCEHPDFARLWLLEGTGKHIEGIDPHGMLRAFSSNRGDRHD